MRACNGPSTLAQWKSIFQGRVFDLQVVGSYLEIGVFISAFLAEDLHAVRQVRNQFLLDAAGSASRSASCEGADMGY